MTYPACHPEPNEGSEFTVSNLSVKTKTALSGCFSFVRLYAIAKLKSELYQKAYVPDEYETELMLTGTTVAGKFNWLPVPSVESV